MKSCSEPEACNGPISLNFGIQRTTINAKCCTTDLCNTGSVPGNIFILQYINYTAWWGGGYHNHSLTFTLGGKEEAGSVMEIGGGILPLNLQLF